MSTIEDKINKSTSVTPEIFFSVIVAADSISHIHHLQTQGTSSFAAHKALDTFYDEVGEIADKVIEVYQGYTKEIVKYDPKGITFGWNFEPVEYLESIRELVETYRYEVIPKEQTHIHNELDNLMTLIDQTVYRLTFLK